jgi:hypothetical protein
MKLPEIVERFGWGVLLSIGPFIAGALIYTGVSMLLDAKGSDYQLFMYAGILAAAYWALEGDWVTKDEPYSAQLVVQNLAVALVAGTVFCGMHLIWAFYLFDWLEWSIKWIGIPVGLSAGASMVMGGRKDLWNIRYEKQRAEEAEV